MKETQKQTSKISNHTTYEANQGQRQNQLAQQNNNNPLAVAHRSFIADIDKSPRMVAQRARIESYSQTPQQSVAKSNSEGLPNNLKSGIESLSGLSMDEVKVHYNSSQPAQLNALAYAQGTDIYVAPRQEKHLPHEAWHVVQQAQGRVKPSMQMKTGVAVNNDQKLEHEADVMGAKALSQSTQTHNVQPKQKLSSGKSAPVQRAIGFEFEFGTWKTKHKDDGSMLDKGEEIVRHGKYKVEGEDAGGAFSAIEVVTVPFTSKDEALPYIERAQKTLKLMSEDVPPVDAAEYRDGNENVVIEPGTPVGKMQASPSISLEKMDRLYANSGGEGYAKAVKSFLLSKEIRKKYLNKQAPSDELMGLVMLVVSYLEQGSRKQALFYPKSAFTIMARTSFDKMMELLPEYAFFSQDENKQKWVELILATAQRVIPSMREEKTGSYKKDWRGKVKRDHKGMAISETRKRSMEEIKSEEVLGMPLMDIAKLAGDEEEKPIYKLKTTREEWLLGMTQGEDKLSKAEDKRFEGMGAYGGAMDVEVLESEAEKSTEQALKKSGLVETMALQKETESTDSIIPEPKRAPLFELRGLRDMFGISQDVNLENWAEKVSAVFDIIDNVNEKSFKPGGKPTIPDDVDNPKIWKKM